MTSAHILDLNRSFTTLTVPTTTKLLEYHLKKSDDDEFTPLEITLTRHWEDTLASRVLTRNIFAVCSSLFVEKDLKDMYMFVRARDMSEESLKFLYREIIENGRTVTIATLCFLTNKFRIFYKHTIFSYP